MPERISVLDPTGFAPEIKGQGMAQRWDSLAGKTIYLIDCRFDDGDIFLQEMQGWLGVHHPEVRTVFARKAGVYTEDDPELFEAIQREAAGVVIGVGH